jgi:hypothetical protein
MYIIPHMPIDRDVHMGMNMCTGPISSITWVAKDDVICHVVFSRQLLHAGTRYHVHVFPEVYHLMAVIAVSPIFGKHATCPLGEHALGGACLWAVDGRASAVRAPRTRRRRVSAAPRAAPTVRCLPRVRRRCSLRGRMDNLRLEAQCSLFLKGGDDHNERLEETAMAQCQLSA